MRLVYNPDSVVQQDTKYLFSACFNKEEEVRGKGAESEMMNYIAIRFILDRRLD